MVAHDPESPTTPPGPGKAMQDPSTSSWRSPASASAPSTAWRVKSNAEVSWIRRAWRVA
jgi:hypothetical protein